MGGYSIILTALMPILCFWVAFMGKQELNSIEFQERYGVFFHQVGYMKSFGNRLWSFIFIMRRILLVFLSFKLSKYPILQFQAFALMNLAVVIYSGLWRPLDTRLRNQFNLFNEAMIMTISTHLACFTDAVSDELTKYKYGWSFIFFLVFTMVVNLALFLKVCVHMVFLILLKYGRIVDSKMQKHN